MDYKVLARKWRPKVFAEVAGQKPIVQALQYALQAGKLHHAYLFTGTRGVGKTTIARILAKALNCEHGVLPEPCNSCANCKAIDEGKYIDVLEIDAASRTKVEDTRELLDNVPYAPVHGRYKIYIIDEVHMLSNHSFNALLKTLEEPPQHVKFLFATTDPQKLPITIISRCIQFHLGVFNNNELVEYLQGILTAEQVSFELPALKQISRAANGSIRDALTLLEQVISLGQGTITDTVVGQILGIANHEAIIDLLAAIVDNKSEQAFAIIQQLSREAVDFAKVLQELAVMLHTIAISQVLPSYLTEQETATVTLAALAKRVAPEEIQLLYQIAIQGKKDLPYAPDLKLGFEMVILRMMVFQPIYQASSVEQQHTILPQQEVVVQNNPSKTISKEIYEEPKFDLKVELTAEPVMELKLSNQILPPQPADWAELIYAMKLTGLTKTVAQHCMITSWKDDQIVLTLDPLHKALLQQHHAQRIQDALQQYLGRTVQLNINIGQTIDDATPAAKRKHKQEKIQQEAEVLVRSKPQVQEILEIFNAKLERVTVKEEA